MQILANVAELWVFSRTVDGPRYLVLEASQEKADAFFGGHRFWQVPGTSMHDDGEATVDLLRRICAASAVHHRVPGTEGRVPPGVERR
ncbi:MAG: dihydroneopterin triphosphate diphosphatase [Actinomycetota bacterium]|nr:dihydroneopterin triphosphate diphosphatase [Actinomycetota bacterium]